MRPFDHYCPQTLDEALALLADRGDSARVIAGGSDLVPLLKAGLATPEAVVDIKHLPELRGLGPDGGDGLRLGTLVSLRELERSNLVRRHHACLAHAAALMASEQIRTFATVGGNLCNASPGADLAPPLIALGADVVLVSTQGSRRIKLEEFFVGPGESRLRPDELMTEILVPPPEGEAVYIKHTRRALMDCAVVGVAAQVSLDGDVCASARICLGAVAPVPMRARRSEAELRGERVTAERIRRSAAVAASECNPIDDVRGAAWYRRRMVEVQLGRALLALTTPGRAS